MHTNCDLTASILCPTTASSLCPGVSIPGEKMVSGSLHSLVGTEIFGGLLGGFQGGGTGGSSGSGAGSSVAFVCDMMEMETPGANDQCKVCAREQMTRSGCADVAWWGHHRMRLQLPTCALHARWVTVQHSAAICVRTGHGLCLRTAPAVLDAFHCSAPASGALTHVGL